MTATATRLWLAALLAPPLLFMGVFFALPFAALVVESLRQGAGFGAGTYRAILGDAYYWGILAETFWFSAKVTAITFVFGYPLAYYLARMAIGSLARRLVFLALLVPLLTSNIVRSFGWIVLLGRNGLVNQTLLDVGMIERPIRFLGTETGIVVGMVHILLPFMVLTVASVLQSVDRAYEEASRDLGGGPVATFRHVVFPLSLPGVVAGSLIVFTLSVSAYVTPSVLGGGRVTVMSMLVFQEYMASLNFTRGAALAITLLVSTLVLIGLYMAVVDRPRRAAGGIA